MLRLTALLLALAAPAALAQSLPDWAAPSPVTHDAATADAALEAAAAAAEDAAPPPPPPIPVDGGLALLALAGAGLAARKLRS